MFIVDIDIINSTYAINFFDTDIKPIIGTYNDTTHIDKLRHNVILKCLSYLNKNNTNAKICIYLYDYNDFTVEIDSNVEIKCINLLSKSFNKKLYDRYAIVHNIALGASIDTKYDIKLGKPKKKKPLKVDT